jgi:hypothetical protein
VNCHRNTIPSPAGAMLFSMARVPAYICTAVYHVARPQTSSVTAYQSTPPILTLFEVSSTTTSMSCSKALTSYEHVLLSCTTDHTITNRVLWRIQCLPSARLHGHRMVTATSCNTAREIHAIRAYRALRLCLVSHNRHKGIRIGPPRENANAEHSMFVA